MERTSLNKYKSFFAEKFREDLNKLINVTTDIANSIYKWIQDSDNYQDFTDQENLLPLIKATNLTGEELLAILNPVHYTAVVSYNEKCNIEDVFDILLEEEIINKDHNTEDLKQKISTFGKPILKLISEQDRKSAPDLPLLYLTSLKTNVVYITEFDSVFDSEKEDVSCYSPTLKRLYPRITLELSFAEDEHKNIGILCNEKTIEMIIKKLIIIKKEIEAANLEMPKDKLIKFY